MNKVQPPINSHNNYHAHVYFDQQSIAFAASLCKEAGRRFNVNIGRVHEKLVGPHPKWSCQIKFTSNEFDELIAWLDQNRNGLSVLVHADTGNDLEDHTLHAYWLGDSVYLNLSMFGA
ncbi:DOPA 4,5-dioxygenase family protein [Vibrio sp. B1FLJ16]|uniref:DOPA 4,5-dioxygenase family protein n=1 Tax=Vibrio sp. B1FLJ16 TaxID=2751178 RepID=UPI0015F704A9|nr:DOPA 4,5-dioxygenase family protein [Vibrio sp. B1FLJ16]CAD7818064.1 COG3805 Aromatic ring-cleaving dioxygenase [Vibrio sp. B1FLJ16]CAD7819095.1 COG3805 Aromatic ring-cleaving dioxygenase [Vibrio sp. B1FLJ16]CAE6933203.1 COG3805 Aromatic ring-cleaving dioxygenase [Vibrio sp. B1FLJ16]CAE6937356.1 COG3805 Aromatic ring-cleaving dioxygenase [Vibrio sp. B1FLJ16]